MYRPLLSLTRSIFDWAAPGSLIGEKCMNRVQIIGHIVSDPKVLVVDERRQLVFFDVDTNEEFQKTLEDGSDQQSDEATCHVVIDRPVLREYVTNNLVKGSRVLCNGSLQNRSRVGEDGKEFKQTSVVLHDILTVEDNRKHNTTQMEIATRNATQDRRFMNHAQILGRIVSDLRVVWLNEQRPVVFFDLETNLMAFKKTLEDVFDQQSKATWHSVMVTRPGLCHNVAKYLVKGSRVLCNGALQNKIMVGEDGKELKSTHILLRDFFEIADKYKKPNTRQEMENQMETFY